MSFSKIQETTQTRLKSIIEKAVAAAVRPSVVNIALGELNPDTLGDIHAAWTGLTRNTSLENSSLLIHIIRADLQCMSCFHRYYPKNKETSCPQCGGLGAKVLSGEEFHLISVEEKHE